MVIKNASCQKGRLLIMQKTTRNRKKKKENLKPKTYFK